MARKRRLRFGLRDVLAGRLRIAQGQRWRIANFDLLPSPALARERVRDLRADIAKPGDSSIQKARIQLNGCGLGILSMLIICR